MTRLCRLDELADRSGRGFTVERDGKPTPIMVIRVGATVRGYVNVCPHLGVALDWAPDSFLDFQKRHILCGKHGALFRIGDGLCVQGPCVGRALTPVALELADGEVRLST